SGLSEKRLFVDAAEIPEFVIKRRMCNSLDTLSKFALGPAYEETLVENLTVGGQFFISFFDFEGVAVEGPHAAIIAPPICSDCTLNGGDLNEPEFWK
ncbi:MAG: hypothetical protein AAF519_17135, partial [Bacteroidota bacterium]